jgi:hypothetical protein
MADNWDDGSDDDWDADDDELTQRLGQKKVEAALPTFDDEEDFGSERQGRCGEGELRRTQKKGNAMVSKKSRSAKRNSELAKHAMKLEMELKQTCRRMNCES